MNIIKAGVLTLALGFSSFVYADSDADEGANFCGDARLNAAHIMRNLQNGVYVKDYVREFKNKYTHPNNAEYYSDTMYLYNLKTISKAWISYRPAGTEAQKRKTIKEFSEEVYRECASNN
jgi:hypothetical protein